MMPTPPADAGRTTPRPRLLAATGPLLLTPLDWIMDAVADAGYTGVEVMFGHSPETRTPERVRAAADRAGLDVPAVHGPYLLLMRSVLGTNYVKKSQRSLELAAAIGADIMVAHAPFRWERKALSWLRSEMPDEAAAIGCRFGMENLFPVAGRNFSAAVTVDDLLGYPHVVFDTSHFAVAGIDLFAAWEQLAERVVHLHVSDNFGHGKDSHAPVGAGVLPLARFLRQVGRSGYAGTVTLELDCRAYLQTRDSLVSFLERERVKVEGLLAGTAEDPLDEPTVGQAPSV